MTENNGRQIDITDAMREDFVASFLIVTGDPEDTILKRDLRSAFAHWLSEKHGRYRKDIDNLEAGNLHGIIFDTLGPIEESRDANGHAIFVGLVMTIASGPRQTFFSPREMRTHDWTTRRIQDLGDRMESRLEICPCGTWRVRLIERDTNIKILKDVVVHVEYSKSYEVAKEYHGSLCPHTGRLP